MTLLSQGLIVDYLTSTNCPIWELCCYIIYHMFYIIKFNLFFFINYCVIIYDMSLQKTEEFNKNVVMVYAEDSSFTGYKALEESKINSIASQSSGLLNQLTTLNNKIQTTGNLYSTILVHQMDLNSQFDNVDVGGFAGADISGMRSAIESNFINYSTIDLEYSGSNMTGVFYKLNNNLVRTLSMNYSGSFLTKVTKIDY